MRRTCTMAQHHPCPMSWTVFVFLTLCPTISQAVTEQIVVEPESGIRYAVIHDDPKTKQDAVDYCKSTYGTGLASFYTLAILTTWKDVFETTKPYHPYEYDLWVQGTSMILNEFIVTIDAMRYGRVDGATDAPYCVALKMADWGAYAPVYWSRPCDGLYDFICTAPLVAASGPCAVTIKEDCGWPGITEEECYKRGCCFDTGSPACFLSSEFIDGYFRYPGVMLTSSGHTAVALVTSLQSCSESCKLDESCAAFFYMPNNTLHPCTHSTKGISIMHDDRTGQVYTYQKYFRSTLECGQVAVHDPGTGDLFSGNKSLWDCINSCYGNTTCFSLQSTHNDGSETPFCDQYSKTIPTIPLTTSVDTFFDYYCRQGYAVFDMEDQPMDKLYRLYNDTATCETGSSLGNPHQMLKLRIPWPFSYAAFTPGPTHLLVVGNESMECENEGFPPSTFNPYTVLVYAKKRGMDAVKYYADFAGESTLCPAISTNIVEGQKECIFQCECATQLCDNIFLFIASNSIEICVLYYSPPP